MLSPVELLLFDEVAEAVRGLVPRAFGELRCRPRRYGVKVWFDTANPGKEHYEVQVIGPQLVPEGSARVIALEVGFHTEHPDVARNDDVLGHLVKHARRWRRQLGPEAQAGPFLGREDTWRRVSETWPDPDLSDPELPFELGARLADYVLALEPCRRTQVASVTSS